MNAKPCYCGQCGPIPAGVKPHPCTSIQETLAGRYRLEQSRNPLWPFGVLRRVTTGAALLLVLAAPAFAAPAPCVVNVSTCTVVSCAFLPGVGQAKGAAISQAHPANEEELLAVDGIGEKTIEKMRPWLAFTGETTCTSKQTAPKSTDGAK